MESFSILFWVERNIYTWGRKDVVLEIGRV